MSRSDPVPQSGWQQARELWHESGIEWEPSAEPAKQPGFSEYQPSAIAGQSWHANGRPRMALPSLPLAEAEPGHAVEQGLAAEPGLAAGPERSAEHKNTAKPELTAEPGRTMEPDRTADAESAPPPAFVVMPLGAPTFADAPAAAWSETGPWPEAMPQPEAVLRPVRRPPPEPDELFRAWEGSVRQASATPNRSGRRKAWQVVRAGVPIAVIVTVGAGAVMMLTGKPADMLADQAQQRNQAPGPKDAIGTPGSLTAIRFSGYPGQQGAVVVSSIASAGGIRMAVGSADGHAAIWLRRASGAWTLVSATSPAVYLRPGVERLTSITHGPTGWIAVGDVVSGAAQQSVVVTSADGLTWRAVDGMAAFAGPDTFVYGVTAGHGGYVVVGKQVSRGRVYAAMWWSADLRSWLPGSNGGLDGRLASSTTYAVTAAPIGFVAAGTHGNCHSVWTSPDGRHWQVHDVLVPPGATSAMLNLLAVNGNSVVAAGYAVMRDGNVPIVVVSMDGGRHWRQSVLSASGGFGAVTALTAAGSGFVAAGQAGPPGEQQSVTWSSQDGRTWSPASPAGAGGRQITALTAVGGAVTGTAQQGTDPSVVMLPAP